MRRRLSPGLWWRLVIFVSLIAVAVGVAVVLDLPNVHEVRRRVDSYGWAAPVVFAGGYALITLAPVPKNVLSAAVGLIFGLVAGALLVWIAAVLGALIAFGLGRLLGRDAVERLTSTRIQKVDELLARSGLLAVIMVRLVPVIPFTAINYAAGLTGIRLWQYTVGTALGIIPGTVAYVALGTYGTNPGSWPFVVSATALILVSVGGLLVAYRRRRSTERRMGR